MSASAMGRNLQNVVVPSPLLSASVWPRILSTYCYQSGVLVYFFALLGRVYFIKCFLFNLSLQWCCTYRQVFSTFLSAKEKSCKEMLNFMPGIDILDNFCSCSYTMMPPQCTIYDFFIIYYIKSDKKKLIFIFRLSNSIFPYYIFVESYQRQKLENYYTYKVEMNVLLIFLVRLLIQVSTICICKVRTIEAQRAKKT